MDRSHSTIQKPGLRLIKLSAIHYRLVNATAALLPDLPNQERKNASAADLLACFDTIIALILAISDSKT